MYKIAIPSYKRSGILLEKTLATLSEGRILSKYIYIFVANNDEKKDYEERIPTHFYNKIVVGKKGITNQRLFIKRYFKEGEYIISIDDDVEGVFKLINDKFKKIGDLDKFFKKAYNELKTNNLYIWGVYPVKNDFYMKGAKEITTNLKFIIGVLYGFIVRNDKNIEPNIKSEGKEDYEQSILYYLKDGGVLRFNKIATKTKFLSPGGLGEIDKRYGVNKRAANYLQKKYPEFVTIFHRKNGMAEIKLRDSRNSTNKKTKKKTSQKKLRKTRKRN